MTVALRRHGRGGKDLREVAAGRRAPAGCCGTRRRPGRERILAPATGDLAGGWAVPEKARTVVDARYVLAAAGLLAQEHPDAAAALVTGVLAP